MSVRPSLPLGRARLPKLRVWRAAHSYALLVYAATASFPRDERFGLTSQLRRAAVSIPANIAEGLGVVATRMRVGFQMHSHLVARRSAHAAAQDLELLTPSSLPHSRASLARSAMLAASSRARDPSNLREPRAESREPRAESRSSPLCRSATRRRIFVRCEQGSPSLRDRRRGRRSRLAVPSRFPDHRARAVAHARDRSRARRLLLSRALDRPPWRTHRGSVPGRRFPPHVVELAGGGQIPSTRSFEATT